MNEEIEIEMLYTLKKWEDKQWNYICSSTRFNDIINKVKSIINFDPDTFNPSDYMITNRISKIRKTVLLEADINFIPQ